MFVNSPHKTTRSENLPTGVEIIKPTLNDINPALRRKFAERLVEGTYNRLGPELDEGNESEIIEAARMECRDILRSAKSKPSCSPEEWTNIKRAVRKTAVDDKDRDNYEEIEQLLEKDETALSNDEWRQLMDLAYPTSTKQEEIETYIKNIERGLESGNFLAIQVDGNIASIISGHSGWIKWPDGRDCFEIGRAATLPEYSGRGFYKILAKKVEDQVRENNPNAPIMRGTKTEIVKASLRKKGLKEIPFSYGLDDPKVDTESLDYKIAKSYRDLLDSYSTLETKKWIRDGYSLFYVDPLEA